MELVVEEDLPINFDFTIQAKEYLGIELPQLNFD
jgi:hypothetical protein